MWYGIVIFPSVILRPGTYLGGGGGRCIKMGCRISNSPIILT